MQRHRVAVGAQEQRQRCTRSGPVVCCETLASTDLGAIFKVSDIASSAPQGPVMLAPPLRSAA